jgi:hypothetical protein
VDSGKGSDVRGDLHQRNGIPVRISDNALLRGHDGLALPSGKSFASNGNIVALLSKFTVDNTLGPFSVAPHKALDKTCLALQTVSI